MRRIAGLLTTIALIACGDSTATPTTSGAVRTPLEPGAGAQYELTPNQRRDVAALRAATDPFHRFDAAHAAGWDTQFPAGCFASPAGGMGFHWLRNANVGTLDPSKPQFVMYEPQRDGSMKLVGVEFIFPGSPTDTPPVLFDVPFTYNTTFNVWALHVWVWQHNPAGLFADWNPTVSCAYAGSAPITKHH